MSAPPSTVPTAIAALFSMVQSQAATDASASQILVTTGEPGMDSPNDIIQIATNVRRRVVPEAFMGGYDQLGPLKETYDIDNIVSTWSGSADPVAAITRVYQLADLIESAVRFDPSLGTTVVEAHPGGTDGGNPEWTTDPVGRLCTLTVTVSVFTLN
jgi:hypothetical protein